MRERASTSPPAYSHGHVHAPSSAGSGTGANHNHSHSSSHSSSSSNSHSSSNSAAKRVAGEQLFRRLGLRAFQSPQQQQQQQRVEQGEEQGKEQGEQQGGVRLPGGPVCSAVLACALLVLYFYMAFLSKLLPPTGHALLDALREDRFYCFLLPLCVLPTYLILYLNWLSMRVFEGS